MSLAVLCHFSQIILNETRCRSVCFLVKFRFFIQELWEKSLYKYCMNIDDGHIMRSWRSCLFMFVVIKTFVTDISASTGRNDFIFDIWLWHGDLYCVSPFQVYCTSTSCLPFDLRIFHVFTAFSGNES
jgi:hypothetical protein